MIVPATTVNDPAMHAVPVLIKDENGKGKDKAMSTNDEQQSVDKPLVTTVDNEGPIVTRRELWAYYRKFRCSL